MFYNVALKLQCKKELRNTEIKVKSNTQRLNNEKLQDMTYLKIY